MSARIFVTGGSGFLGQELIRTLTRTHDVLALVRSSKAQHAVEQAGAMPVYGDLFDMGQLSSIMRGCHSVYHLAGVNGWDLPPAQCQQMRMVNIVGTKTMCAAARSAGIGRFIYVSSVTAISQAQVTSKSSFRGSVYGETKLQAERHVLQQNDSKMETVVVRPASVQGRRLTGTGKLMLAMANETLPVFVQSTFYLLSIDDCVRGLIAAASHGHPGMAYTLSGPGLSTQELYSQLETALRTRPLRRAPILPNWMALTLATITTGICHLLGRKAAPMGTEKVQAMLRNNADFLTNDAHDDLGWEPEPTQIWVSKALNWYREMDLL